MSWIEKINSELIIITGDGKEWKPLWVPTNRGTDYNVPEFEFIGLNGTLAKRTTVKGRKFNIKFYFQGDDHLDVVADFETSANDKRPWVISHPFYNSITVQPLSLDFDDSKYNCTQITGTVLETITEDNPKITTDPVDKIKLDKEALDNTFVEAFDVTPDSTDLNTLTSNTDKFHSEGERIILINLESEQYFNLFNTANASILNGTAKPLEAIRAIQAVINYPAITTTSIKSRMELLRTQFSDLRETIAGITNRNGKKIYENNAGALISAQALASSTPITGDYEDKNSVLEVVESILTDYDTYLADLDSLQTDNGGEPDSYIPDASSIIALNALISYTISNLFNIALGSKQERTVYLEEDSNIILLAHRFYGLLPDDSTIDTIMKNNNIGINEMLQVRKGRKIVYYV
jgi:hypothetical protein